MPKKTYKLPALVRHPRFGRAIRRSGYEVEYEWVRRSIRGDCERIFPETAIPANLLKQATSINPREWYVDILRTCSDCSRHFIFYAAEQRYWYEVLGFPVNVDCVKCPECRKSDQTLRRRLQRYSRAIGRTELSIDEFTALVRDAVFVWRNGLIKKREKLHRIRNQARRRIPHHAATREIEQLIAELDRQPERIESD